MIDFWNFLPEIFLLISFLSLVLFAVWYSNFSKFYKLVLGTQVLFLSVELLLIAAFLLLSFLYFSIQPQIFEFYFINYFLIQFKLFITIVTIGVLLISFNYIDKNKNNLNLQSFEFSLLIVVIILSMFLIISSSNFISLYLSIELQSLSLYVLVSLKKNEAALQASLKYFILGSFSSVLFLFAFSLLYGISGVSNFVDIQAYLASEAHFLHNLN